MSDIVVSVSGEAINIVVTPDNPISIITVAEQGPPGSGSVVLSGSTAAPDPTGLADGTVYFQYEV